MTVIHQTTRRKSATQTITTETEREQRTLRVKPGRSQGARSGRKVFVAEYPAKAYVAFGRTRHEALGKLLIDEPCVAGYLGIILEVS